MKKLILFVSFLSTAALADGIPVPMNKQTPYNWICDGRVSLHLMLKNPLENIATLYIGNGSTIGAGVGPAIESLLLQKDYRRLDNISSAKDQFDRVLSFKSDSNNKVLSVVMTDLKYRTEIKAMNCRAQF